MTPQRFSQLLSFVGPFIKRQNTRLREAIPPDERLALNYTPSFLTCNVKVEQNSSPYVTLISITCRATRECECPYVTLRSTYVTLSDQCESALRSVINLPGPSPLESALFTLQCFVYLRFTSVMLER